MKVKRFTITTRMGRRWKLYAPQFEDDKRTQQFFSFPVTYTLTDVVNRVLRWAAVRERAGSEMRKAGKRLLACKPLRLFTTVRP